MLLFGDLVLIVFLFRFLFVVVVATLLPLAFLLLILVSHYWNVSVIIVGDRGGGCVEFLDFGRRHHMQWIDIASKDFERVSHGIDLLYGINIFLIDVVDFLEMEN